MEKICKDTTNRWTGKGEKHKEHYPKAIDFTPVFTVDIKTGERRGEIPR